MNPTLLKYTINFLYKTTIYKIYDNDNIIKNKRLNQKR